MQINEHQHNFKDKGYGEDCECVRMVNIGQSLGQPTIFIRYNPDQYVTNKKKHVLSHYKKVIILKQYLDGALNKQIDELEDIGYLSMVQLFYDGYMETNVEYVTIQEFEHKKTYIFKVDIIDFLIGLYCNKYDDKATNDILRKRNNINIQKLRFIMNTIDNRENNNNKDILNWYNKYNRLTQKKLMDIINISIDKNKMKPVKKQPKMK